MLFYRGKIPAQIKTVIFEKNRRWLKSFSFLCFFTISVLIGVDYRRIDQLFSTPFIGVSGKRFGTLAGC
jgi:hypothetical protein